MRYLICLLIFILGCLPETDSLPNEESTDSPTQEEVDLPPPPEQEKSPGGCDSYNAIHGDVQGKVIVIPVECNPYWFDNGDPIEEFLKIPQEELIKFSA